MILPVLSTSVALLPRENVTRLSSGAPAKKFRYSDAPPNGLPPPKPSISPEAPLHRPETFLYSPVPSASPDTPLYSPTDTAYALLSPD